MSNFSPTLADKLAVRTSDGSAIDIALQVLAVIRPDLYQQYPRARLEKLANGEAIAELEEELISLREQLSEFQCPYCMSQMIQSVEAPLDDGEKHWDSVRTFECGYEEFGGTKRRLCPNDPEFPKFSEYELMYNEEQGTGSHAGWICNALPRTRSARLVPLSQAFGPTQQRATAEMERGYEQRAKPWTHRFGRLP